MVNHRLLSGCVGLVLCCGCQRAEEGHYVSSRAVQKLPEQMQQGIAVELAKYCGTPAAPKLLGSDRATRQHLQHGAQVFRDRCAACHGATGDGAGPAAANMNPKPRDYRPGIFKFTSTAYGQRPLREDLVRIVRAGAKGTSMPSFNLLADEDLQAVVDYVLVLTHRGELEQALALEADQEEEIDPEATPELIEEILARWESAKDNIVMPISKQIPYSLESAELGRQAFYTETAGCVKCHGEDGRGRDIPNFMLPGATEPITVRSADLLVGMFRGGSRPEDIYRRIFAGINGTPMPGFGQSLSNQPDTLWHLVNFVQYISATRRRDVVEHMPVLQRKSSEGADENANQGKTNGAAAGPSATLHNRQVSS